MLQRGLVQDAAQLSKAHRVWYNFFEPSQLQASKARGEAELAARDSGISVIEERSADRPLRTVAEDLQSASDKAIHLEHTHQPQSAFFACTPHGPRMHAVHICCRARSDNAV